MNRPVRIIKRDTEDSKELQPKKCEKTDRQITREIIRTVKGWISEFEQHRDDNHHVLKSNSVAIRTALLIGFMMLLGSSTNGNAQQLRDAFQKVEQAVVIVRTRQKELAPFPQDGMVSMDGLGSGVLISNDGKVLTAAHLVQTADNTVVEFPDGELISARVTGSAVDADVAILQLQSLPKNIAPVALGDSDKAEVGEEVFVIGALYGLSHTLTAGHISGRHRLDNRIGDTDAMEFLQTDAAINQGNSGGPMFNMDGEVIGIVTNIMSKSGGSEGLGFAATSNMARRLLLDQKPFWSGIEGILVKGNLAKALNLSQPAALLVERVAAESPGARAGIRAGSVRANIEGEELILGGDFILAINGLPFEATDENYTRIYASLTKLKPGNNMEIKVVRQGQIITLSIPINP
jgi:S1-C subfamily serine protease